MTTSTISSIKEYLDDTITNRTSSSAIPVLYASKSWIVHLAEYFLRLVCIILFFLCPWANFQLIQFFRLRVFYKESSSKWYIIFKAVFDTVFSIISIPVIFFLTFNIDIIHHNTFTCKFVTYAHYTSDDLISILLTFLCIDRMIRITFGYHLRKRCSFTISIILITLFLNLNIHRLGRSEHIDGFCHKVYSSLWDYNFDIYYSYIFIAITWFVILIASINLFVSVYCDRVRNRKLRQQGQPSLALQENMKKISSNSIESDRLGLIDSTDDWEDPAVVVIETTTPANNSTDQEQQDNADLQITVSVLITSVLFLLCNLPNFIVFIVRVIFDSGYNTLGNLAVYLSLFPLVIAHTINYFIFNHLPAYLLRRNST